jgi:23S rRNA pseudouridine2605 synthase
MSNDGDLINRLTHPRFNQEKVYHVMVSGKVDLETIRKSCSTIVIDNYKIKPVKVRFLEKAENPKYTWLEFILSEGRNRQIRKMCEKLDLKIHQIIRVRIKNIILGDLKPSQWRDLNKKELNSLKSIIL